MIPRVKVNIKVKANTISEINKKENKPFISFAILRSSKLAKSDTNIAKQLNLIIIHNSKSRQAPATRPCRGLLTSPAF